MFLENVEPPKASLPFDGGAKKYSGKEKCTEGDLSGVCLACFRQHCPSGCGPSGFAAAILSRCDGERFSPMVCIGVTTAMGCVSVLGGAITARLGKCLREKGGILGPFGEATRPRFSFAVGFRTRFGKRSRIKIMASNAVPMQARSVSLPEISFLDFLLISGVLHEEGI